MTEAVCHRMVVWPVALAALWWSIGAIIVRSIRADDGTTIFWRPARIPATIFLFIAIRKRGALSFHVRFVERHGVVRSWMLGRVFAPGAVFVMVARNTGIPAIADGGIRLSTVFAKAAFDFLGAGPA
jgi:hypothetical protein